eukprot:GHVQ01005970.1.p1 GENE.GHVQ01005970.1~~GHVQ01005970.1.p1  ORF type:complete len:137 (+),score=11.23 GHVQ01005970.1:518-928(+)
MVLGCTTSRQVWNIGCTTGTAMAINPDSNIHSPLPQPLSRGTKWLDPTVSSWGWAAHNATTGSFPLASHRDAPHCKQGSSRATATSRVPLVHSPSNPIPAKAQLVYTYMKTDIRRYGTNSIKERGPESQVRYIYIQ